MTKDELSMVGIEIVAYSGDARSTLLESLNLRKLLLLDH